MIRIRSASFDDALAIADVHVETWRNGYPGLIPDAVLVRLSRRAQSDAWSRVLKRPQGPHQVLVAESDDGELWGFGSCGPSRESLLPHAGEIYTLYIRPEHQEQGLGRDLLLALHDNLSNRGFRGALAWVLAGNPARFFYQAMGAKPIAEKIERIWNTDLSQTAYAWRELRALERRQGTP